MKKRILYALVACLMGSIIVLTSCAEKTPTQTTTATTTATTTKTTTATTTATTAATTATSTSTVKTTTVTLKKTDGTTMTKTAEVPQYGGVLVHCRPSHYGGWDETTTSRAYFIRQRIVEENLFTGNWLYGQSGTNEYSFYCYAPEPLKYQAGCLAESWEKLNDTTFIFHIRKGVYFQNLPPVNGRQMDATDVVYSINRIYATKTADLTTNAPGGLIPTATATDNWTVTLTFRDPVFASMIFEDVSHTLCILPKEVKSCNLASEVIATGPYIVKDEVWNSQTTYVRNPNYWMKDPIFPNNQLPYLDGIKWLIIPDTATQVAAIRTYKVDQMKDVTVEDERQLVKSVPGLNVKGISYESPYIIWMRMDKAPFNNLKVRQALQMAIDQPTIKDTLFYGEAGLFDCPIHSISDLSWVYTPLDKMPQDVQAIYTYNPTKAKQLLADAGYPDGFKTEVVTPNTPAFVDLLSVVKSEWAQIGVDLTISQKDSATMTTIGASKSYDQLLYYYFGTQRFWTMSYFRAGNYYDFGFINDPKVDETLTKVWQDYFDQDKRAQDMKDFVVYAVRQSWWLNVPNRTLYAVWQPYVHNYHGEMAMGYYAYYEWMRYAWIDTALKDKLQGK